MEAGPLGESLKLTLGCLKEGFEFYQPLGTRKFDPVSSWMESNRGLLPRHPWRIRPNAARLAL